MILSNLVRDDPRGFIDLDNNLARHVGKGNVDAFHEEAGNLVVDSLTDDPKLFELLTKDDAVVAELNAALHAVDRRAFGRAAGSAPRAALGREFRASIATPGATRSLVHAELLTNGVINDRTMRNPAIMEILDKKVRELLNSKRR